MAAAWLLGAVLAVLALSHVPAATAWSGTAVDTVSGSKIVAMPVAKRLSPAGDLGPLDAVLPPVLLLVLATGVVATALAAPTRRVRSGPRPRPARGPPVALH